MKRKKRRHIYQGPVEAEEPARKSKDRETNEVVEEAPIGTTFDLHNDERKTLVQIGDILYKLVPTEVTLRDLKKEKFKNIPHVRRLNPIPNRTEFEQQIKNEEQKDIHKLAKHSRNESGRVTSIRKAMAIGADVPALIKDLMKQKKEAQKAGDEDKARKIRRQLRGLDYRRYIQEIK
jgi:hypothetical protein